MKMTGFFSSPARKTAMEGEAGSLAATKCWIKFKEARKVIMPNMLDWIRLIKLMIIVTLVFGEATFSVAAQVLKQACALFMALSPSATASSRAFLSTFSVHGWCDQEEGCPIPERKCFESVAQMRKIQALRFDCERHGFRQIFRTPSLNSS
jgi:hypothetical protein